MSMVINLVEDHNIYLCEGGPVYNSGVQPTPPPITYLTQWKIVGNSEVHTLPYPDGVVLPNGYKRCKYLTFDGSSYIDTGIIPEQGIGVSIKFKYLEELADDGIFGCRVSAWSADSFYCFRQGSLTSGMLFVSYGGKICDSTSTGNFVINANDEIELHLDSNSLSFTNGTNTFTKNHNYQITKGAKTLYIGGLNGYGRKSCIILRTFVLTNGVGNTIFNGIPCLDDNNVPCLYDTVSGTSFYNDGTGTFGYEIEPQPTEIWSCGEYNATDDKYHILVQPLGGSIADIALDEPLRKVNNVADTIEFPSNTEGKALVTRSLGGIDLGTTTPSKLKTDTRNKFRFSFICNNIKGVASSSIIGNVLCATLSVRASVETNNCVDNTIAISTIPSIMIYKEDYATKSEQEVQAAVDGVIVIYELATPTTELVDAPQIEEAESYTCVISQGGKAVSWSEFLDTLNYLLTDNENNLLVESENYKLTVQS